MIYADLNFYITEYLMGRKETIPLTEFLFWSRKAGVIINKYTFNRLIEYDDTFEEVKHCACEIAEILYTESKANSLSAVQSVSVPESISKTYRDQRQTPQTQAQTVQSVLFRWLSDVEINGTNVLFRG